ncbi:putative Beta-glucosidase [Quillaja saponaria]|uniref:Beta-glucosidase n=1 Tax=Quillaja saponaria TaxID=32244 RepID=A0AAD7KN16_QUISA|nr:putative Beta-glucosidase [Quillaja saponaria]
MEPFVTIMHFDLPLALEQEFGGFLNRSMMNYYEDYCELLFEAYGDRVKNWITFNEPNVATTFGYMWGFGPPYSRKCLPPKCVKPVGDKTREPYIVTHNYILAHAAAVKLYRKKFQATQRGKVGIVLQVSDYKPVTLEHENVAAAQRLLDFHTGWYVEPLVFGHYPQSLKVILKDRLPTFTGKERKMKDISTGPCLIILNGLMASAKDMGFTTLIFKTISIACQKNLLNGSMHSSMAIPLEPPRLFANNLLTELLVEKGVSGMM